MPRRVHPVAWWLWAAGLATAASRTDNPLLLLAVVLFIAYGSILWGVLPTVGSNISWQAHLSGAVGGVIAAFLLKRKRPAPVGTDRFASDR